MTINLVNEISALKVWSEERNLSIESQQAGFKGNFFEEVAEFYRASNDYEKVDALCDMLVFVINASGSINRRTDRLFEIMQVAWKDGDKYSDCEYHLENAMTCLMKCGVGYTDDTLPVNYLLSAIAALGFYPQKCLSETIKEISSRTGKYSNELKKFVKDKGAYSLKDLHDKLIKDNSVEAYEITENEDCFVVDTLYSNNEREEVKYTKWYRADYEKCKA